MLPDNTTHYTQAQLIQLINYVKDSFVVNPDMLQSIGEPSDKFSHRWVAERFPMSVKLTIDGVEKPILIELPDYAFTTEGWE